MERKNLIVALGDALTEIAPEIDARAIDPARSLRRQVDLDSADWLDFLVAVQQRTGVQIPDSQAGRLATLDQIADFVLAHGG